MKNMVACLLAASTGALLATAFTIEANAACGELVVSKGDIKIESGKSKALAPANEGSKICSGDTIISGAQSRAKIKMEDGNELNISPDSKVALEKYEYSPAQNRKQVLLNILSGKVRAATKHENMYNDQDSSGQANSFQVRTKSAVAGVRGTDFLTGYNPANNKSEVVTFRGKVEFGQPGPGGQILNAVQVAAGQKTEAIAGQAPAAPRAMPKAELDKANSETKVDSADRKKEDSGAKDSAGKKDSEKKESDKKDPTAASAAREPAAESNVKNDNGGGSAAAKDPAGSNKEPSARAPATATTSGAAAGSVAGSTGAPATAPAISQGPGGQLPSLNANSSGGSMISVGDLGKDPGIAPALPRTPGSVVPVIPILAPSTGITPPKVPVCDYCNHVIKNGPSNLNIKINFQN
jgi:hypothetical protein